ncbi:hypothetical protein Cgig2_003686 [Carnegiea gigantea]|uniref:Uncharacterized protein n=1 Tax=Carnegiea gigantea TaxID=171969 RepID=A0A9Q1KG57_9CARY|nr:hypothetical protein Cgig2_003686 [Carnegiea gigantea]
MEAQRRSSSRRKPLADCTNTIAAAAGRNFSPSAAKSTAGPLKPSIYAATKPNPKPPTSSSSIKTTTSTGSNNPPNGDSPLSGPHASDPPAPPTPLSDSGGRDRRKIGPSAVQSWQDEKAGRNEGSKSSENPIIQGAKPVIRQALMRSSSIASVQEQKLDAQIRKEKGKMVLETPIIEITDLFKSDVPLASSSAASGNWHCSEPPPFQDQTLNAQKMKDKGKMVLETPNIEATGLLGSHKSLASSSAASGHCHVSGPPTVQNEKSDAQKRKDKGKMVLEIPIIEITDPLRPHMSLASCSAASGDCRFSGFPAAQVQKMDAQKWKGRGKMVLETPNIGTTDLLRPHMSLASSSAAFGNCHSLGPPAVQNKKRGNQESMDKGERVLETQKIVTTDSGRLQAPLTSSSAVSPSHYLLGPPMVEYQKLDVAKSKDKGKMVQETLDIGATDPSTPQAPLASSSATSGASDQERPLCLTVYNQRRALRSRKHADGKSIALSCPPSKRTKNMRMELGDDSGKKKYRSHTDPLPVHKKSRKNHVDPVHIMPLDEIERLRAYYAEVDAFELTEEVASDSD